MNKKQLKYAVQVNKYANQLRKTQTPAELRLHHLLSATGVPFNVQVPLVCRAKGDSRSGLQRRYIADAYITEAQLVIEADGGGHKTDKGIHYDRGRDDLLYQTRGISVWRLDNHVIMSFGEKEFETRLWAIIEDTRGPGIVSILRKRWGLHGE